MAAAPAAAWAAHDAAQEEAAAACRFDSLLQLFPLLMHGATQAATLLGWRGMPGSEVFQRVASTLLVALFWVLPTFFPAFYMRRRTFFILSSRTSFFAWPLLRKPRGGAGGAAGGAAPADFDVHPLGRRAHHLPIAYACCFLAAHLPLLRLAWHNCTVLCTA